MLRPDDSHASFGSTAILKRIGARLRKAFPGARLQSRLDGEYATPQIVEYLDQARTGYVIAMAKNAVLNEIAEPLMEKARWDSYYSGDSEHPYDESRYAAESWDDIE